MKLFKWFYGFVQITLVGNELPRFLRLCSNKGLLVWDISFVKWNHVQLKMRASDLLRSKDALRKTKSRFSIDKKYGFPFFVFRYQRKSIYAVCIFGMLFALYFLSGFIWRVEIIGNSYLSDERIQNYLEQKRCGIGSSIHRINPEKMEKMMLKDFPEIIWNSVSIHGTTMHISIKEQIQNDVTKKQTAKSEDLLSPIDGTVERIFVRNGTAAVAIGDKVKKGDILVYGWVPIMDQSNTQMIAVNEGVADADVMVKGKFPVRFEIPTSYQKHMYTGKKRSYFFFGSNSGNYNIIPILYGKMQHTTLRQTKQVKIMNTIELPLYWNRVLEKEFSFVTQTYTKPQLSGMQQKNCNNYIKNLEEKGIQIIDKNVMISYGNRTCEMRGCVIGLCPATSHAPSTIPMIENIGNDSL